MRASAFLLLVVLAIAGCGSGGGSPGKSGPVDLGTGTAVQVAARDRLNVYRTASGAGKAGLVEPIKSAAVRHAGYQALKVRSGYFQTTGGGPLDPADSAAALFSGIDVGARMRVAFLSYNALNPADQPDLALPITADERLAPTGSTATGAALVDALWVGIYSRLPLMRHGYIGFGYGDRAHAGEAFPANGIDPDGDAMATLDFGEAPGVARSYGLWPNRAVGKVTGSYDPGKDEPPMTLLTGRGILGVPSHLIHPTGLPWTFITATVTPVTLPSGFPAVPATPIGPAQSPFIVVSSTAVTGPDVIQDSPTSILPGELFIVPKAALASGWWQIQVVATTQGESVSSNYVWEIQSR
ncbi:hypothetical protein LBMAG53_18460 [Planctomycetota bacterium]|nr:hypothetical protein LBMAG53_18460 [Planctomycetota bacterium]